MKKTKKFDSVKMKNEAQANLLAEYQKKKDQYSNFADFVKKKAQEASSWQQKMRKKFAKSKDKASA